MTAFHRPARLIVIDDQPMMAKLVRQMIESFGHQVVGMGKDGIEGPALINEHRPDALICDINMPKVNGLSLLKAIRCGRAGPRTDLPVLLLTARSEAPVMKAALALDVNAFLIKPANAADLSDRLNRILTQQRPVKDPDHYLRIAIPNVDGQENPLGAGAAKPVALRPPAGARQVTIAEAPLGAKLAAPVYSGDGSMVMEAGIEVTSDVLEQLTSLKQLGIIADAISIG